MMRILEACLALSLITAAQSSRSADQSWIAPRPGDIGYMDTIVSSMKSPDEGPAFQPFRPSIVLRASEPLARSQTDAQLAASFVRGQAIDALLSPLDEVGAAGRVTAFALHIASGEEFDWFDIASAALGESFKASFMGARVFFTPSEIADDFKVGGPISSWRAYETNRIDEQVWEFERRARELQELDQRERERFERFERWQNTAGRPVIVANSRTRSVAPRDCKTLSKERTKITYGGSGYHLDCPQSQSHLSGRKANAGAARSGPTAEPPALDDEIGAGQAPQDRGSTARPTSPAGAGLCLFGSRGRLQKSFPLPQPTTFHQSPGDGRHSRHAAPSRA